MAQRGNEEVCQSRVRLGCGTGARPVTLFNDEFTAMETEARVGSASKYLMTVRGEKLVQKQKGKPTLLSRLLVRLLRNLGIRFTVAGTQYVPFGLFEKDRLSDPDKEIDALLNRVGATCRLMTFLTFLTFQHSEN